MRAAHAERAGLGARAPRRSAPVSAGSHSACTVCAGPALLHHDRRDPRVVRAGGEQRGDGVGEHLAGGVVDVGLEQPHRLAGVAGATLRRCGRRSPPARRSGGPAMSARAGAVADGARRASPASGRTRRRARSSARRRSGVVSSVRSSMPYGSARRASEQPTTAGAGLGSSPWAARTVPWPTVIGLQTMRSMPSTSSAAHVPTMSTMASTEPTSWNSTSSAAIRCIAPSTSASAGTCASARSRTRVGQVGRVEQLADHAVRPVPVLRSWSCVVVVVRMSCVAVRRRSRGSWCVDHDDGVGGGDAAAQHRLERRARSRRSAAGRRCRRRPRGSAPASTSAPRVMSPAMPAKQWNQAVRVIGRWLPEHPGDGAGRAEAVVDADHGDAARARRVHRQQAR